MDEEIAEQQRRDIERQQQAAADEQRRISNQKIIDRQERDRRATEDGR